MSQQEWERDEQRYARDADGDPDDRPTPDEYEGLGTAPRRPSTDPWKLSDPPGRMQP